MLRLRHPIPLRSLALAVLLLLPAAPLALLCRGRTPTRFEAKNLPSWERVPTVRPILPPVSAHTGKHRARVKTVT